VRPNNVGVAGFADTILRKDKTIEAILATLNSLNQKADYMILQSFSPIGRSFHAAIVPCLHEVDPVDQPAGNRERDTGALSHSSKENQATAANTSPDVGMDSAAPSFGFLQHGMTGWHEHLSQSAVQEEDMLREPIIEISRAEEDNLARYISLANQNDPFGASEPHHICH
jgi:hypothetical protein